MSPQGTVLPSTDETRSYLIGWWCFLSSCRKESFSALRTAERSSTGMFTRPKAREPFQMDAIVPRSQGTTRAIHHLCTFSTPVAGPVRRPHTRVSFTPARIGSRFALRGTHGRITHHRGRSMESEEGTQRCMD